MRGWMNIKIQRGRLKLHLSRISSQLFNIPLCFFLLTEILLYSFLSSSLFLTLLVLIFLLFPSLYHYFLSHFTLLFLHLSFVCFRTEEEMEEERRRTDAIPYEQADEPVEEEEDEEPEGK